MQESPSNRRDRTCNYARRILRLFRALPRDDLARTLGRQLLRSGTPVGANCREACRSRLVVKVPAGRKIVFYSGPQED